MKREIKAPEDIKNLLKNLQPELARKYKIKKIGIFGSWIKGEQKRKSDLDILVEFEENAEISLFDFIEIKEYLSKKIGVKVDLVEKKALKPYIGKIILKEVVYL
ncbi:MAG: nucleotidyltransferase family protein [candidate division WOR-3 bacterium]